ncbi:hypothetical protein HM25_002829 [Salmonella enterica subsp. enterica serovar Carno]|nr:hypothetical protein [Salmonella enterica]ECI6490296.1 hypothetical protein [Salmonella enterica subsp. enterica]EDV9643083.1 hypothetical protein [Salmonella enterica subsp. enterica serovar Carno]
MNKLVAEHAASEACYNELAVTANQQTQDVNNEYEKTGTVSRQSQYRMRRARTFVMANLRRMISIRQDMIAIADLAGMSEMSARSRAVLVYFNQMKINEEMSMKELALMHNLHADAYQAFEDDE